MASIQLIKLVSKPSFSSPARRKDWFNESKDFSISIVTKKPSILKRLLASMISDVNLTVSEINLF